MTLQSRTLGQWLRLIYRRGVQLLAAVWLLLLLVLPLYFAWAHRPIPAPEPYAARTDVPAVQSTLIAAILDGEAQYLGASDPDGYPPARFVSARDMAGQWLDESALILPSGDTRPAVLAYLGTLQQLLDRRFGDGDMSYMVDGLATGIIDCDLRTALMVASARQAGVALVGLGAPGHLFVGWKVGTVDQILWETRQRHAGELQQWPNLNSRMTAAVKARWQQPFSDAQITALFVGHVRPYRGALDDALGATPHGEESRLIHDAKAAVATAIASDAATRGDGEDPGYRTARQAIDALARFRPHSLVAARLRFELDAAFHAKALRNDWFWMVGIGHEAARHQRCIQAWGYSAGCTLMDMPIRYSHWLAALWNTPMHENMIRASWFHWVLVMTTVALVGISLVLLSILRLLGWCGRTLVGWVWGRWWRWAAR